MTQPSQAPQDRGDTSSSTDGFPVNKAEHRESEKSWWPFHKTPEVLLQRNFDKQFSGKRGWNGRWYFKPHPVDAEHQNPVISGEQDYGGSLQKDNKGRFIYRNQFGQKSSKYSDVAVYLSPTNFVPKRLIVQSTDSVIRDDLGTGDWRRQRINGHVPVALKLAEWSLSPLRRSQAWYNGLDASLRVLVVCIPLQLLLALPLDNSWKDDDSVDLYTDFPGYHWQWAKHAINPLDQAPIPRDGGKTTVAAGPLVPTARQRLLRPRQLVVLQSDGTWLMTSAAPVSLPYVFISYADKAFATAAGRIKIQDMARRAAQDAGCDAYWLDFLCRAPEKGDLLDSDVYRMCDVIRGSRRVVVMMPDSQAESKKKWGSRMWTLPEALLAPEHRCYFMRETPGGDFLTQPMSLVEMTADVWEDPIDSEEEGGPTRLLAEHYAGLLTLGRLELFTTALDALWHRGEVDYDFFTPNDVTYALMGLLHYRIKRDDTDKEFHSLAQLSLGNDSDQIVERMISLYHRPTGAAAKNPFRSLATKDLFHTHIWDIHPTCQVVGVAHEDNTILLDSCRAMHIRWKGFPRPVVVRDTGFRRLLSMILVTAGTWWFLQGITLAVYYAPLYSGNISGDVKLTMKWMISAFVFIAILLSAFAPFAVRRLYGGQVLQSTSNLVAFEGTLPISQLERIVFGNDNSRLSYDASSTSFSEDHRHPTLREGLEPDWIRDGKPCPVKLPLGHKLFTLVDTGELSVSVFSAERPPTVALLCGREGGMLRAVLCSWEFETDCLHKEAVIRMPTNVWESATPKGWLKMCLSSMNQHRASLREEKLLKEEETKKKAMKKAEEARTKPDLRLNQEELEGSSFENNTPVV